MQADLSQVDYTSIPGSSFDVVVDVRNTSTVIDGIRARILGLDPAWVTGEPDYVALFPDTSDQLRLRVRLPETFPAGDHSLQVEITSDTGANASTTLPGTLHVVELAEPDLSVTPQIATSRREATFTVSCTNNGNAPTVVDLVAFDNEQELDLRLRPGIVELPAGTTSTVVLDVRRRRKWIGGRVTYPITIRGVTASRQIDTRATFIQKSAISSGLVTSGVLALIVALWAAAFLFGIDRILGRDEAVAKMAPASFYEPAAAGADFGGPGAGETAAGAADAASRGLDITAVGGTASGLVIGPDGAGIPKITVAAVRRTPDGIVEASSAATDDDGAYTVGPLVPGDYVLRVGGAGFETTYLPGVPTADAATPVRIAAKEDTPAPDLSVVGLPGSITGSVVTGPGPIGGVEVIIRQVLGPIVEPAPIRPPTFTDVDGNFTFADLATPATYELTVAADSAVYAPANVRISLTGGEDGVVNTVVVTAARGSISGTVSDGEGAPLGGVTVTATSGSTSKEVATPTVGSVGSYALESLPAPGTYVLTFSLDGFGSETVVVDLGAGEDRPLDVVIRGGTVTLSGVVTGRPGPDADPSLIDGATVRVQGESLDVTSTTNSDGTFLVPGLEPGTTVAVTVSADGYVTTTTTVTVTTSTQPLAIELNRSLRSLVGRAVRGGAGLGGATVDLTDGTTKRTIQTASAPAGSFRFTDLPFGSYSLTITAPDGETTTVLLSIDASTPSTLDLGDIDVPEPAAD